MQRAGVAGNENLRAIQHGEKQRQFGNHRQHRRVRQNFFQFRHQLLLARADGRGEGDAQSGGGGESVKFRPVTERPFLFRLAGSDVAKDGSRPAAIFPLPRPEPDRFGFPVRARRARCPTRKADAPAAPTRAALWFPARRAGCSKTGGPKIRRAATSRAARFAPMRKLKIAPRSLLAKSTERSKRSRRNARMTGQVCAGSRFRAGAASARRG